MVVEAEVDQELHRMLLAAVSEVLVQPVPQTCRHLRVAEVQQIGELVVTVHVVEVRPTPLPSLCELSVTVVEVGGHVDLCLCLGG